MQRKIVDDSESWTDRAAHLIYDDYVHNLALRASCSPRGCIFPPARKSGSSASPGASSKSRRGLLRMISARRMVTFIDGIGPEGAGKGSVMFLPAEFTDEQACDALCKFVQVFLSLPLGEAWVSPGKLLMSSNATVYDSLTTVLASVSISPDYNASRSGSPEVLSAAEYKQYLEDRVPAVVRSALQQYNGIAQAGHRHPAARPPREEP